MEPNLAARHQNQILPALRRFQQGHGYLRAEDLKQFSHDTGIPLYRLQEVASYFPHFHLTPPPKLIVRVCQSMACHLAGAKHLLDDLNQLRSDNLRVEGVSCLGRCDRPPAVCVELAPVVDPAPAGGPGANRHEKGGELYYLGREAEVLRQNIGALLDHQLPPGEGDSDSGLADYPSAGWVVDPYKGRTSDYDAVRNLIAARDHGIRRAAEMLSAELSLPPGTASEVLETIRNLQASRSGEAGRNETVDWVQSVWTELDKANLRGMGGAGVPAVQKWSDVREAVAEARRRGRDERAFIVVNGDESEPGTFKDRELLLHFPHLILEAVIVAGLVTDATEGFIYIRHEYHEQIEACEEAIRHAEAKGLCGVNASVLGRPFPVSVFVSPGGYICGEQSALIEAMSDRRGEPRNVPPKIETNGLNNLPTLVSNVETFAWVPYILLNGGDKYASLGVNGRKGRRFFSVSGDVARPGVYETPMGLTLRDLIFGEEYCQGMAQGKDLKAVAPSGPSGGFLPRWLSVGQGLPRKHTENAEWQALAARRGFDPLAQKLDLLDLELELNLFRALSPTQALGAGIVVYAQDRDMTEQAVNAIEFFRNESCGKCVPCRAGSQKMFNLGNNLLAGRIDAGTWDSELLPIVTELGEVMMLASICGLGRSVPMPLRTLVDYFKADLSMHLTDRVEP